MKEKVELSGRAVEFELIRKSVKRINMTIKPDGSITVSANPSVSVSRIKGFIESNGNSVLRTLDRFAAARAKNAPLEFKSGESVKIFGENIALKIFCKDVESVFRVGDTLNITVKSGDKTRIKKIVSAYLKKQCEAAVKKFCEAAYEKYAEKVPEPPKIKFRVMTSRWGSCNYAKNVLTFNYALVQTPLLCVEYVVYHEFTHFIVHNHSEKFYRVLSEFFPNWEKPRRILKNEIVGKDIFV